MGTKGVSWPALPTRSVFDALVLLHTGVHLSQSFINYPGWYVIEAVHDVS